MFTKLANSSFVDVVDVESYWKLVFKIKKVVSGSTITGVTDATLNGANAVTKLLFCSVVRFSPVVDLIDIKTLPYSGLDDTPVLVSKLPSSPPHTETACVFGNNFLV